MLGDFFRLSLNNLKRRKLRSWLTMLGIFIGIAAVVSLITLGQGLREAITGQFASLSTDSLTIQNAETGFGPPGSTAIEKLTERDLRLIKSVSGIKLALPRYIRTARVEFNKIVNFETIVNIPEEEEENEWVYDSGGIRIDEGRLLKKGDLGKVVLGSGVDDEDNFGKQIEIGKKIQIEGEEFEVIGILKTSSNFFMNNAILIIEKDLKEVMGIEDEIDMIIVRVENQNIVEQTAERIKKVLRNDRNLKEGEEDFSVETPLEAINTINSILTAINIVVIGIAAISLIVGGIGIANTMYTSVLERTKEIGTMKAIGAKNSDVLSVFLIEAGLLGLIGGLIGAIIGIGFCYLVSFGANKALGMVLFEVKFSPFLFLGAIGFAFFIGVVAGAIPAIQASKLKPAEALRA